MTNVRNGEIVAEWDLLKFWKTVLAGAIAGLIVAFQGDEGNE